MEILGMCITQFGYQQVLPYIDTYLTISKLECAQRVSDILQGVHKTMCVIIGRIHMELVSSTWMVFIQHTEGGMIPHVGIR
jgi:hypothetical protein